VPPPGQIQHLVVLMMENRSFDHFFGYLKSDDYPIEGLTGNESNPDPNGEPVKVSPDANYSGDLGTDPGHHFPDVAIQIFGNPQGTGEPTMQGFVNDYARMCNGNVAKSHRIMRCFTSKRIPVITTLAQQYAICDHWFSSVPGPTLPNRSFAHAATSVGRLDMNPTWFDEGKTLYELLDESQVSSKIYFHDMSMAQTFKNLQLGDQNKYFGTFNSFLDACKKGTLPTYAFVEPRYNADNSGDALPANDQHPDHDVHEGETLIMDVYNAVRNSPLWEKTLLLVVYDEHGGTYDHVPPPKTVNPDGKVCIDPPFDFTRLGVRVPAVVISPWIEAGTIDSNQYDHASIVTTARKLFLGTEWKSKFLTSRDQAALPCDGTLTRDTPRTDKVDLTQPFRRTTPAVRAARQAEMPLTDFQQNQVKLTELLNQKLPPDKQSPIAPESIQTEADAAAFHKDVLSRAKAQPGQPQAGKAGG
jgi:phospholipase C